MHNNRTDTELFLLSYYIKYDKLLELNSLVDANQYTNCIDIYIDVYDMIRRIYSFSTTGVSKFTITAAIINLAAHFRAYYRTRHHIWTRIFLVYGSEITNNHRQFCPTFSNFIDPTVVGYERTNSLIKSQLELVKILAAYIEDVYYIERATDFTMFTYDNISKTLQHSPNSTSIIVSKNKYAYQIPAMMFGKRVYLFRPVKYKGEDWSICITPNTAITYYYYKVQKDEVRSRLQAMHPELLSTFMALNGCKDKAVPSFVNIDKASRILDAAINMNLILNRYQSNAAWLYDSLCKISDINRSFSLETFVNRFNGLDLVYQHMLYSNMIESKDISWNLNLRDPDTVRDINNKYFIDNPLDLNNL